MAPTLYCSFDCDALQSNNKAARLRMPPYFARRRGVTPRQSRNIRMRVAIANTVQTSKPHARSQNEKDRRELRNNTSAIPSSGRAQSTITKRYEIPCSDNRAPIAPPMRANTAIQLSLRERDSPDLRNKRRPTAHKIAHATRITTQR